MPPNDLEDPDYSWKPPDGVRRDFDLAKAKQLLDEAGYRDSDGDGIREYKGKDITLRLWAETDVPEGQRETKLIAGWFREVGVDIKLAVYDDGVYFDRDLELRRQHLRARLRHLPLGVGRLLRRRSDARLLHDGADRVHRTRWRGRTRSSTV